MKSNWSVFARDTATEKLWIQEIKAHQRVLGTAIGTEVTSALDSAQGMVMVDALNPLWREWIKTVNRVECRIVLVIEEQVGLPLAKDLNLVDDVMVYPFRPAELLSHYRQAVQTSDHHHTQEEVQNAHLALSQANETLERILKVKTPKRFAGIKGISIMSRHLSGLKPGGDYFDVFESERKDFVNFLLADSSSYGLSSALLGMILSSSAKIASDANMNTSAWIKAIFEELKVTLGDREHLSIFFGRLNRRDFALHYQLYGTCEAFIVNQQGECARLEKQGARIHSSFNPEMTESVIKLNPKDRLVILSDGFVNGVGGEQYLNQLFHKQLNQDPFTLVNELSYEIKSKLSPGETFPGEDCSALVIDVENRVLRLAPAG